MHEEINSCDPGLGAACAESLRLAWRVYGPAFALAVVGGIVQWLQDRKSGRRWFEASWDLLASCMISGFTGLVVAHALTALHVGFDWTVAGAAISGHMGTRALYLLQNVLQTWVKVQTAKMTASVKQEALDAAASLEAEFAAGEASGKSFRAAIDAAEKPEARP
jgi:hypothetical protein